MQRGKNVVKAFGGRGCAPDPAGQLTALPRPLAGGNCPLPKNPAPVLGPSGPSASRQQILKTPLLMMSFL